MSTPTLDEIRSWPVTVPLWPDAAQCVRMGRSAVYDAHRRGVLPFPVLQLGRRLIVPTASLLAALGVETATGPVPADPATPLADHPVPTGNGRDEG